MNHFYSALLRHRLYPISLLLMILLLAGCASTQVAPTDSIDAAKGAISSAEQAGARQHANNDLQEARTRLRMAEQAIVEEDMDAADRFAQQSRAAAELAIAKTESAKAEAIIRQREREADALGTLMHRQGDQS